MLGRLVGGCSEIAVTQSTATSAQPDYFLAVFQYLRLNLLSFLVTCNGA